MRRLILLAWLLALAGEAMGQFSAEDDSLIAATSFYKASDFQQYQRPGNSDRPMVSRDKGPVARYNPVSLLLKGSMWAYQHVITKQLSSPCPYQISCSNFAKLSIEDFGIFKGTALAADRLMRCTRISLMDVPPLDFDSKTHHILDDPRWYAWHQH
jgi:putative component of membrane protein insertase Oxa1/YidC/SpoIIIJ protein YidD